MILTKQQWRDLIESVLPTNNRKLIKAVHHRDLLKKLSEAVGTTDWIVDDNVTNEKLSHMPANTFKANVTGSDTNPQNVPINFLVDIVKENSENLIYQGFKKTIPAGQTRSVFNNQASEFRSWNIAYPNDSVNNFIPDSYLDVGDKIKIDFYYKNANADDPYFTVDMGSSSIFLSSDTEFDNTSNSNPNYVGRVEIEIIILSKSTTTGSVFAIFNHTLNTSGLGPTNPDTQKDVVIKEIDNIDTENFNSIDVQGYLAISDSSTIFYSELSIIKNSLT